MEVLEQIEKIEERLSQVEALVHELVAAGHNDAGFAFPQPLADALARFYTASSHSVRFLSLLDAGEIAIMYSCAIAMAFAGDETRAALYDTPPTLGAFASALGSILDSESARSSADPILRTILGSFRRPNGKPTASARYLLDEFVTVRNRERGHASALPEGAYEDCWRRMESVLIENLGQCDQLRLRFVRVESVNFGRADWFEYPIILLNGISAARGRTPVLSKDRIKPGSACVWDGAQRLIPLSPIVEYRVCSVCALEHCFFLEKVRAPNLHFHSYTANHRVVVPGSLD